MIGGGTNNSEYELLTSNSMYLLNADAPFNYMDLTKGSNICRLLKEYGYNAAAMHCAVPTNYNRNKAYSAMSFDKTYLGKDSFNYFSMNGNRPWLDDDNYKDLIDIYETMGDGPRFMYLLTYQNHGGYEQNDNSVDTIHVNEDYGELTDDINEYLSSVKLSAEAFKELTASLNEVDREVTVLMVGDHAPSFITSIPDEYYDGQINKNIDASSVPYVLWSNKGVNSTSFLEYSSMVDLIPLALESMGLPLTNYYQYILDLHEIVPVRTSSGTYMSKESCLSSYAVSDLNDNTEYKVNIMAYYNMEYYGLTAK